jgi:hypothetical protein
VLEIDNLPSQFVFVFSVRTHTYLSQNGKQAHFTVFRSLQSGRIWIWLIFDMRKRRNQKASESVTELSFESVIVNDGTGYGMRD